MLVFPDHRQKNLQEHQSAQIVTAAQVSGTVQRHVARHQAGGQNRARDNKFSNARYSWSCTLKPALLKIALLGQYRRHKPPVNISGYAPGCDFPSCARSAESRPSSSMADASCATSPRRTTRPFQLSSTRSAVHPAASLEITGRPHAMASFTTSPQGSVCDGKTNASANA